MCDLANNCMSFFLPAHFGARRGLRKCDLGHLGIPTAEEYSQMYCGLMGVEHPENWNFYLAFAFFRLAVMLQGCHRGSLAGRPAAGDSSPKDAEFVAELAWDFAIKEGFRVFENLPPTKLLARHCSTWAGQRPFLGRSYSTWARPGAAPVPTAPCWEWPRVFAARWKTWASSGAFWDAIPEGLHVLCQNCRQRVPGLRQWC